MHHRLREAGLSLEVPLDIRMKAWEPLQGSLHKYCHLNPNRRTNLVGSRKTERVRIKPKVKKVRAAKKAVRKQRNLSERSIESNLTLVPMITILEILDKLTLIHNNNHINLKWELKI